MVVVVFSNRVRGRVKFLSGRLLLDSESDDGDRFVSGRLMLQENKVEHLEADFHGDLPWSKTAAPRFLLFSANLTSCPG